MRLFYNVLFYSALPLLLLRLYQRGKKAPAYRVRIAERFGFFPAPRFSQQPVWVHAVSVGESIAIAPLVEKLLAANEIVVLTCSTPTGSQRIKAMFGERVFHCYAPYDYPGAVKRFLNNTQPKLALMMETEVWPNSLHHCAQRNIATVLVNARMSAKSAKGYAKLAALSQPMFSSLTKVLAQSEADARRLQDLGVASPEVTGSLKFDVEISPQAQAEAAQIKQQLQQKSFTWIAASTHAGEDEQVLAAHKALLASHPDALLLLVPRHPERFNEVAELVESMGLTLARRSQTQGQNRDIQAQVLLGDSMGEMMSFFGAVDAAFIGGSLVPNGGHNFLEAAAWGLPLLSGPEVFNFQQISELLVQQGGLRFVADSEGLAEQLLEFAKDDAARAAVGRLALELVEANRGALARQWHAVEALL